MINNSLPKARQDETAEKFEEKIREIRLKEKEALTVQKAAQFNLPYINLKGFPITPEALSSFSKEQAEKFKIICFLNTGLHIRVGVMEPDQLEIKELLFQLEEKFHGKAELYLISEESFQNGFKLYDNLPAYREIKRGVEISSKDLEKFQKEKITFTDLQEKIKKVSITELVNLIVAASLQARSSDIHIEAEEKEIKVRFRIDGLLHEAASLSSELWKKIISRIKLLAKLKINIENQPQDGRFTIFLEKEKVDVRVSTIPTAYGESVVMRLLMSSTASLEFDQIGLRGNAYEHLKKEIERPNGMIITTGPTGSGKTTTLYAVLNKLNKPEVKIITLEDPIEYKLKGINQSQIDISKEYTFAKGLKSILRQDPDVVMVGEIRDLETADIAINAALTGHLVISTIHTNSAAGALPRFLAMDVKPFLLAPSLNAIIGQRLVRKICEKCKEEISIEKEKMEEIKKILEKLPQSEYKIDWNNLKFYQGKGCPSCNNIGYRGRLGIFEIMPMNPEIEKTILSGKISEYIIQDIAVKNGMVTMIQDGLLKAIDGLTSVEEIFRVVE